MMNYAPKRSDEPIWWGLFGAGGTWFAILTPVTVLLMGILLPLHGLGLIDLSYDKLVNLVSSPVGAIFTVLTLALPMWHAMHRVHHGLHDLQVHVGAVGKYACYVVAAVVTLLAVIWVAMLA
ncbi:fumarate reductase subunit FrdD [Shewanella dokdonensis]|uniref:Fumarate reductase subunit D n=1 Tax=Shewanella dokdonensis TaxID=712036 RepID=A0ABX8DC52_9GAMM|nr:fumarate reductase subunit FrdD [Shewanella dokdonensis]MCL1074659.1 fumarate reductase subunit FrdD [Shewanella dokdonensis]QVK22352.1 fumarate reductase subunit FrdD [Shewanella dokdonensis]